MSRITPYLTEMTNDTEISVGGITLDTAKAKDVFGAQRRMMTCDLVNKIENRLVTHTSL